MFAAFLLAAALTFPTIPQLSTGAKPLDPSPTVTQFTFVVAGDNRPAKAKDGLTQPLKDIVAAVKSSEPAFIVWNGDTVSGKTAVVVGPQSAAFLAAFQGVSAPLFNAPGNHEMVHNIKCTATKESGEYPYKDMARAYAKAMAPRHGMFRYGNAAFVLVNTDDLLDVTLADHCKYNGYVSPAQLSALTSTLDQLEHDATVTHVFLFMHRPIHDDGSHQIGNGKSDTSKYGKQVEAFRHAVDHGGYKKLLFVFASHDHRFAVYPAGAALSGTSPSSGGEPAFIITGGAGAPLSGCAKGSGNPGAYYHYLTVTVNGGQVTVTPQPLYGTKTCTPPPAGSP